MRFIYFACLALLVWPMPAQAQGTGDYLRDNPGFATERGAAGSSGAHDSTTGSTRILATARLTASPASLEWAGGSDWRVVTVTNEGEMGTGPMEIALAGSGFEYRNISCTTMGAGQNCRIELRPDGGSGTAATLTVSSPHAGAAQVALSLALVTRTFNVNYSSGCVRGYCSCHVGYGGRHHVPGVGTCHKPRPQSARAICIYKGCQDLVSYNLRLGIVGRRQCHSPDGSSGCFTNASSLNCQCTTVTCSGCPPE